MATSSLTETETEPRGGVIARRLREIAGAGLIVLAALVAVALFGHDASDPSLNLAGSGPSSNPLGFIGATVSDILYQCIGLAVWAPVVIVPLWGLRLVAGRPFAWFGLALAALLFGMLAAAAYLASLDLPERWPYYVGLGGVVGDFIMHRMERPFGPENYAGTAGIAAVLLLLVSLGITAQEVWHGVVTLVRAPFGGRRQPPPERRRYDQALDERLAPSRPERGSRGRPGLGARIATRFTSLFRRRQAPAAETPTFAETPSAFEGAGAGARRRRPVARTKAAGDPGAAGPPPDEVADSMSGPAVPPQAVPPRSASDAAPAPAKRGKAVRAAAADESNDLVPENRFELPPLRFLSQSRGRDRVTIDRAALKQTAEGLERVLDDFGVRGEIVDVRPGPVVTLYELEPAPGTRAARVIALADDIARSLCAMSVRVATVPGRNVIGIELPNDGRETVFLRDLLASPAYEDTAAKLTLALGKDIGGEPIVVDLARMPHLLIAGTTGSGKSVAINAMILSLLYRLPPDQLRFILVDPKVIELSVYDGIPHLLAPVVTEPHKAVVALKWVVREMDERYRLMSHLGVRDIFAFNRRMAEAMGRGEELSRRVQTGFEPGTGVPVFEQQPIEMKQMPLICVVVDEVADLMLTAGKEIEGAIQRLSQKARAAGIHLIVATQRPSVDVLTGVIKANLPSRISFRVSSKIDSRTILGEPGAEQLLGQGDMLFMMPGERIFRIHGPLVTDEEVERVVGYLKEQGEPDYIEAVTDEAAMEGQGSLGTPFGEVGNGEDAQYRQALQIVAKEGKASTSFLQRKMRIGYNSAARLVERLETDGHVSAPDHVGRRRVLLGEGGEPLDI